VKIKRNMRRNKTISEYIDKCSKGEIILIKLKRRCWVENGI
jgi:hypothetical protein